MGQTLLKPKATPKIILVAAPVLQDSDSSRTGLPCVKCSIQLEFDAQLPCQKPFSGRLPKGQSQSDQIRS